MVNWKKFFVEEDENLQASTNKKKKTKNRLENWFEEKSEEDKLEISELDLEEAEDKLEKDGQEEKITEKATLKTVNKEKSQVLYEETEYDDFAEYEEKLNQKNSNEGFIAKFVALFRTEEKTQEASTTDIKKDKPEDYKTYLEREKNKIKEKTAEIDAKETYDLDINEDKYRDDFFDDFEEQEETGKQKTFLNTIKSKFSAITRYGLREDKDLPNDYETLENEEVPTQEEVKAKKEGKFSRLMDKIVTSKKEEDKANYSDDDLYIEYQDKSISDELEKIEEKEALDKQEKDNKNIQEKLKTLGIDSDSVKDVDIFGERGERRAHPTLASVKVKRIIQDHKIESLGSDLVFEGNKDNFAKETFEKELEKTSVEKLEVEGEHTSKNKEEIARLNNDFNQLNRKQDKISHNSNCLKTEENKNLEKALSEIKEQEEIAKLDSKDYTLKVEESDSEKERREKLKYTSVEDVLEGSEDLFETDIDRVAKKLVVNRNSAEQDEHSEEIEQFRKDVFKEKTSADLIADKDQKTELDKLILDTNIVEHKKQAEEEEELKKLEENLAIIKEENRFKEELDAEFAEEISIEKIAKESEYEFEDYDLLKVEKDKEEDILAGYSDYHLGLEEIEALTIKNRIDSASENANIETLTKDLATKKYKERLIDDIEKFTIEKTTPARKIEENAEESKENKGSKEIKEEKEVGIKYNERLYSNEVGQYFVDDSSPMTFGEYRTQDRGYRPVSKEKIEENQRKLEAIFEKYANNKMPKRNTTSYVEQRISSPNINVGKYKPSQIVSAVYGTAKPKRPIVEKKETAKKLTQEQPNYIKEIASQEEVVWNIDVSNRVPKSNIKAKTKTPRKKQNNKGKGEK